MKVRVEIMAGLSERLTPGQQGRQAVFDSQSQTLYNNIQVVINGRLLIPLKNLNVELRDGDRILFLPAYAGG